MGFFNPNAFAAATGETGVINAQYAVGDVRRYGVFPDGVDLTGLTFTAGSGVITAAPGTFTSAMIGKVVCSPALTGALTATTPKIGSVAADGSSATLAAAAVAVGTLNGGARVGTAWDGTNLMVPLLANAALPGVELYWPPGFYVMGFNLNSAASNNTKMYFAEAEFSSVVHLISGIDNVRMRGHVVTHDRFGAVGLTDSDLSGLTVRCKSDPTKHVSGVRGRGVHLVSCKDSLFGPIEVDDCVVGGTAYNTDAAVAIDDSTMSNLVFSRIWVKDCDGHAVALLGPNHTIGEIRVDGWGASVHDRSFAETTSVAQGMELCGAWMRRCPGLKADVLRLNQKPAAVLANCITNATPSVTGAVGAFSGVRKGQSVAGTGIASHSLAGIGTTISSAALTGAGFSALSPGQPVSGTGIPAGSFIQAIASDTAATLSQLATATGSITLAAPCVVKAVSLAGDSLTLSIAATASATVSLTFDRVCAQYGLRADETNNCSGIAAPFDKPRIERLIARNVARRGNSIGDRNNPTAFLSELEIASVEASAMAGTILTAGYALLHVNAALTPAITGFNKVTVNGLTVHDTNGNDTLQVPVNTYCVIGSVDSSRGVNGTIVNWQGHGQLGACKHKHVGGSGTTPPFILTPATAGLQSTFGPFQIDDGGNAPSVIAIDMIGAVDCQLRGATINGHRGIGTLRLMNMQRAVIENVRISATAAGGWGIRWNGNTDVTLSGVTVTGHTFGITANGAGATSSPTRCSWTNVISTGNTANTDIPAIDNAAGKLVQIANCLTATL